MLLISLDRPISTSGALEQSDSSHVFTSIVHAFVCARIDYCNSLLVGLPKVHFSPIQSVLNATARLISRLPRTSHISAFMIDHLHWLPLIARIQLKVLTLMYRSHIGQASRYLRDHIRLPSSAISLRPLRSFDRHDLFVPRAKTSMAQTRAFAIIGPSLWNQLLPTTRSTLLTGEPSASFRSLIRLPFSLWVSRTGSASDWCALQEALYKCIDTIQYNPPKPRSCPKRQCWQ